tara:strand:+ start:2418 stop:3017 length:600 start_codon:yes stop_codon:yes gene_type:complete
MNLQIYSDPWEYGIVDNFLSPDRFNTIQDLARIEFEKYKKVGSNTPTGKYTNYVKDDLIPELTKEFMSFQDHRKYNKLVKLNHWVIMSPNTVYPCHIDNSSRIHTSVLYVAPEKNKGTILCDNPSTNDNGDHNQPDKPSDREVEIEWKPNRLFAHNPRPKTWHRFMSGDNERVNLTVFFADPDKILSHRMDFDYFIDCD